MRNTPTLFKLRAAFAFSLLAACSSSSDDGVDDAGNEARDAASATAGNGAGTSATAGNEGSAASSGSDGTTNDSGMAMLDDDGGPFIGEPGTPVNLASAADFVILAKTGISTVPAAMITGNIGVSPAAASYITGFSLSADASNVFSTAPQVSGRVYAADYAAPTPSKMTAAIGDMAQAFTDASGRAPDFTELGAGDIGGMTLEPGVYKWGTGLLIPSDVKLSGDENAVWIFQIAQDLTMSNGKKISLTGGASSKNVFWQVSGQVTLGTTAHLEGIVLSQTSITLGTGASINGRLLAQTSVDIDTSDVTQPAQ